MAVNEWSASQGLLQRDYNPDMLDKSFELVWGRRDQHDDVLEPYFEDVKAESFTYKMTSWGSIVPLPARNEDSERMPLVQPAPDFPKTLTLLAYRSGIQVTDNFMAGDRFGAVAPMMTGLVKSAMRRLTYLRADIFNNAFTGTAGSDGSPLIDDAHDEINPEIAKWDNEATGPLSGGNLQAMRLLADKQKDERGNPDFVQLVDLLIPPDLMQKAEELISSKLVAENAQNARTVLIDQMNIVKSHFLTSTTAYYGIGDMTGPERGLFQAFLTKPNVKNFDSGNADILLSKRVKFVVAIDFSRTKNIYGALGL